MPYLGNEPAVAYTSTTKDSFSGDASTTDFTMSKSANVNAVRVVVENVVQNPTVAYTCSGTTLSFTSAPPTGTNNIYVVHLGPPAATIAPPTTINNATTFTADLTVDDGADIITASKGTDNVRLGEGAGDSIASGGNQNVAIGKDAGTALTTGDSNTFIGAKVGDAITTSSGNVAIGGDATYAALGSDTQGKFTTAVGVGALRAQNFTSDTASNNVAVGYFAGGVMDDGTANTFVGSLAGDDCVNGNNNTAVGKGSLSADAGDNNTAVGLEALRDTTGSVNTAIGKNSGNAISSGTKNTIIGSYTGNQNSLDIRTASNNIVLSDGDGNPRVHHDGTTFKVLGNSQNNTICSIINASSANPYGMSISFTGNAPNNTTEYFLNCGDTGGVRAQIKSNGNLQNANNSYGAYSDQKLKENIVDSGSQWEDIKAVRVRKYSLKTDELDAPNKLGVIAQELEASKMNGLVSIEPDLDPDTKEDLGTETKSVQYSVLYMKAVKALQEAMTRIETLESENTAIKARLDALEAG